MNIQPTLVNELVTLRPMNKEDFEEVYSVASDPKLWDQYPSFDRYKREVYRKHFDERLASKGALVIIDNETKSIIGSSSYYKLTPQSVCVGYTFISRKYWGTMYNASVKKLMLEHAFEFVDYVIFHVANINYRSQKAVEKLGAKLIGSEEKVNDLGVKNINLVYKLLKK